MNPGMNPIGLDSDEQACWAAAEDAVALSYNQGAGGFGAHDGLGPAPVPALRHLRGGASGSSFGMHDIIR